jgi:PAS domain S-box-containing protein
MRFLDANETECRALGYSREELLAMTVFDIDPAFDKAAAKMLQKQLLNTGGAQFTGVHRRKDGSTFPVEINAGFIELDRPYLLGIVRDITERQRSEDELREREIAYRTLAENLPGMVYRVFIREGGRMRFYNEMNVQMTGYTADDLAIGEVCSIEPLMLDTDRPGVVDEVTRAVEEERPFAVEYRVKHKDGSIRWLSERGMPVRGPDDQPLYIDGVIFDVTERKQTEDRLRLFRTLLDNSSDTIEVVEPPAMRFLDINETACRALGYGREEMLAMTVFDIDPVLDEGMVKTLDKQLRKSGSAQFTGVHRRKDGSTFPVEISIARIEFDRPYWLAIARDVTERQLAAAVLARANRALRVLSACNLALVQASTEDELLHGVVDAIANMDGYNLAVVDFIGDGPGNELTPIVWSGMGKAAYWAQGMSWGDTKYGKSPVSKAVRSGKTQICHDIASDPGFKPWRDDALALGLVSNIALPLSEHGKVFGALSIYSYDLDAFYEDEEIRLLEELAGNLSYGIMAMRTRVEHEQHATILRQSLVQSIQTIAATVEARDPYTAGHQQRVAHLATAVARKMDLPEERVDGIGLAGIIHDLGKIHIPAEILSKPGKLTDVEYMLVQAHPQSGYDILKDVTFPWPIADIILQHHERLDGSGYPQGLKNGKILLEARIIGVADVVEAMSSHRPYRAGLGLEAALEEIERNRGKWYDPEAVDACLKLFREDGYKLSA